MEECQGVRAERNRCLIAGPRLPTMTLCLLPSLLNTRLQRSYSSAWLILTFELCGPIKIREAPSQVRYPLTRGGRTSMS